MNTVRVQVPATSANCGPGFDCLGLAFVWQQSTKEFPYEYDVPAYTIFCCMPAVSLMFLYYELQGSYEQIQSRIGFDNFSLG